MSLGKGLNVRSIPIEINGSSVVVCKAINKCFANGDGVAVSVSNEFPYLGGNRENLINFSFVSKDSPQAVASKINFATSNGVKVVFAPTPFSSEVEVLFISPNLETDTLLEGFFALYE